MEPQAYKIESLPFFKQFYGNGDAIIDVSLFMKWIEEAFEYMNEDDLEDREEAYRELDRGESLNLKAVIEEW